MNRSSGKFSAPILKVTWFLPSRQSRCTVGWDWLEAALPAGILRRVTLVETANNVFEYCGDTIPAR